MHQQLRMTQLSSIYTYRACPMTQSKSLQEQYVTLYTAIGELQAEPYDEKAYEALSAIHRAAFALVEVEHSKLPGYFTNLSLDGEGESLEVQAFDLCDEIETQVFDGVLAWPMSIVSSKVVDRALLVALKELVLSAYRRAATAAGQPDLAIRFAQAQTYTVYRVTESDVLEGL